MAGRSRRFPAKNMLWGLLSIAGAAGVLIVAGTLTRFELVLGPVVIRSQHGLSLPMLTPEGGAFRPAKGGPEPTLPETQGQPRNLILVVGDGMGLGMVSSASAVLKGPDGALAFEHFPVIGLVKTFAANSLVTDSGAAATAMATGFKTDKTMISILPNGRVAVTLFEAARARGMATGVVTTSGLMDATPAAFTAHNTSRNNEAAILANQLLSGTDVMIGAAWGHLDRLEEEPELAAALNEARARGVAIVTSEEDLEAATAPFVALLPPRTGSPDAGGPPLVRSVAKALEELQKNADGFLLLVESEETDQMGHENHARRVVDAVAELDEAVQYILELAESRQDTLVLVTADHETGGMAIVRGRPKEQRADIRWATDRHTSVWVPIFAIGPGASMFGGVLDNTEIARRVAGLLNLEEFPTLIPAK